MLIWRLNKSCNFSFAHNAFVTNARSIIVTDNREKSDESYYPKNLCVNEHVDVSTVSEWRESTKSQTKMKTTVELRGGLTKRKERWVKRKPTNSIDLDQFPLIFLVLLLSSSFYGSELYLCLWTKRHTTTKTTTMAATKAWPNKKRCLHRKYLLSFHFEYA